MKSVIETFKDIPFYEGLYQVSNYGAVRSIRFGKVRYLKNGKNRFGYEFVCLCIDGKPKHFTVHRLVYEAFVGPIPDGYEIDHINGVKDDNRINNLRVVTPKQNSHNPVTRKRYLDSIKKRSDNEVWLKNNREGIRNRCNKPVLQIDKKTGEVIKQWECARDVHRELGVRQGDISRCCNGKRNSAGGFKWKFAE